MHIESISFFKFLNDFRFKRNVVQDSVMMVEKRGTFLAKRKGDDSYKENHGSRRILKTLEIKEKYF